MPAAQYRANLLREDARARPHSTTAASASPQSHPLAAPASPVALNPWEHSEPYPSESSNPHHPCESTSASPAPATASSPAKPHPPPPAWSRVSSAYEDPPPPS